jgi:acyl-CoA thioesterase FadM
MKTEIRYSMVDSGMHVTLLSLAKIIEDATTAFLNDNGFSSKELNHTYHAIMVVLRNHIHFIKRVHFMDVLDSKVDVIRKSSVAIILRTRLYRSGEFDPCVESYIQLSSIDMVTRRLRNLDEFNAYQNLLAEEEISIKGIFNRYLETMDNPTRKEILVESTDIDYSNHLNNIAYVRYFLNCLPSSKLRHLPYKEMEVNYIKEAREGEHVTIEYQEMENILLFLLKDDQGNILTRAKVTL